MVLQSETFPGGYQQQSYSQDGYYSTGYGHGPNTHLGPIPSLISPHMTPSSGYGPHHHYQPGWHSTSTDYHSHGSKGHMSSSFSGGSSFSHGMPTGGFGSSFHEATHGPMGSKVESMKHDYSSSYGNGRPSMFHNPMHGDDYSSYGNGRPSMFYNPMHDSHQSAEWKLKSIEDDD